MKEMNCQFERLTTRDGFNTSVRHIQAAIGAVERVEARENLADILLDLVQENEITQDQLPAIVSMVLGDKFRYVLKTHNIVSPVEDLASVAVACSKINACDLVLVYQHPDLGYIVANPKNPLQLAAIVNFAKYEFITVYAGNFAKPASNSCVDACEYVINLLDGGKAKPAPALLKGDCSYKQPKKKNDPVGKVPKAGKVPAKQKASSSGKPDTSRYPKAYVKPQGNAQEPAEAAAPAAREPIPGAKMTPKYAVLVTNELFHNGNVEAWKKIIASYSAKHPDLEVMVYYDGERIMNLNSLFTWGKVKRGTCIEFAVAGNDIVDVAKLQRYLRQGASHLFEAFLKGSMNSVLQLF